MYICPNPLTVSELDPNSSPLHQSPANAVTTCTPHCHPPKKKKTKYVSSLSFIVFKFTSVLEAPHLLQECTDVFISSQHVWFQASSMLSMRSSLYTSVTTILQCITFQKSKDLILMVLANVQQLQLNTQMSRLMLPSLQLLHHHIHPVNLMHFQVVFKTSGSLIFYT